VPHRRASTRRAADARSRRAEPDDKVLGVPLHDPYYEEFFDIADIPQHLLKEIEHFFERYKDLEGKRVQITGWAKSDQAMRMVRDAIKLYDATYRQVGT
jgi:inorganic pyrophosphatase